MGEMKPDSKGSVIWGVSSDKPSMTEYLIRRCTKDVFIVDSSPALWGQEMMGKKIVSPAGLTDLPSGEVRLIIATYLHIDEIKEQAAALGHKAVSFVHDMKEEYADYRLQDYPRDENGYLPTMLHINFTERCNLRCVWCYFHGVAGLKET